MKIQFLELKIRLVLSAEKSQNKSLTMDWFKLENFPVKFTEKIPNELLTLDCSWLEISFGRIRWKITKKIIDFGLPSTWIFVQSNPLKNWQKFTLFHPNSSWKDFILKIALNSDKSSCNLSSGRSTTRSLHPGGLNYCLTRKHFCRALCELTWR